MFAYRIVIHKVQCVHADYETVYGVIYRFQGSVQNDLSGGIPGAIGISQNALKTHASNVAF